MSTPVRWYRDVYRDALWEADGLDSAAKAVAETYARHARDGQGRKGPAADLAWLTYERLMAKAGIGRRAKVSTAISGLVRAGWLKVVTQVPRRPTVYRLTIPASSDGGTTDAEVGSSDGGTTVVPLSEAGSSTLSGLPQARSSDGGTQPLKTIRKSPTLSQATTPAAMLAALGVDEGERDRLIHKIEEQNNVNSPGWWITANRNGTLADCLHRARADPPDTLGATWDEARRNGGKTTPSSNRTPGRNSFRPYRNPEDPATAHPGYQHIHRPYQDDPTADYHAPL